MILLSLDEMKSLYMNYNVHADTGKIIARLSDYRPVCIRSGAIYFEKEKVPLEPGNEYDHFGIKWNQYGTVMMQKPGEVSFTRIGRLVNR